MDNFVYVSDTDQYGITDRWKVMTEDADGKLRGDCEDWALTYAFRDSGESWPVFWWRVLTLHYIFWHCVSVHGAGHMVLFVRGSGYIDNIFPVFNKKTEHKLRLPWIGPLLAIKWSLDIIARPLRRAF